MSRISADDQLNFLLKCVKHSNNGKVDFTAVAEECSIVSKGAAAKRYERMMKANGINPNGGPASLEDESPEKPAATPKKTPKTPTKAKGPGTPKSDTPKKRRGGKSANSTPTKKVKSEEKVVDADSDDADGGTQVPVKKENGLSGNNDPFFTQPPTQMNGEDPLFAQFCNTAATSANGGEQDSAPGGIFRKMFSIKEEDDEA